MVGNPDVSVIIVNWNGRHWLDTCLPALQSQTYPHFEIVLIDNGSTDDSITWLQQHWPQVRLLPQNHNTGFAAANNLGIQATSTPYIVTLNNDTRPHPTWLAELVTAVTNSAAGMVASAILHWHNPSLLDSAGIEVDRAGIAWQRHRNQPVATPTETAVFGPSAAAALYRRDMLNQIGLFDPDFFAYYEDVDLAWRAQLAGWRCHYAVTAKVEHWHSATAAKIPDRKLYLMSRNKIWTLLKNLSPRQLRRYLPTILLYDLMAAAYQVSRTRRFTAVHGRIDALKQRHIALAKRPSTFPPVPLTPITPPWQITTKS